MKKFFFLFAIVAVLVPFTGTAQAPELRSWKLNTTGATGYNGYLTNVQSVWYTGTDVYVKCTSVPDYTIGPWQSNPNTPALQNFTFKITRSPQKNNGTPVNTPLGHTGVWSNGVSIFNAKDGMTYMNQGKWNRDALFWEGISFDNCLGHPAPGGEYHHHVNPRCLYDDTDSTHHSPIIGYAFDGFPIYGAYGYANADGTGGIKRMRTSFVVTTATTRANGPAMSAQYPAGCFIEDYTYTAGAGDLDDHNGRFCVTPDYPNGTYAYFVTINDQLKPVYPYSAGPTYYGVVQAGNTGPGSGRNTVPANAVEYKMSTTVPSVSISASANATVCEGTPLTFTATPQNGGSAPTYQWLKNGKSVGGNTSSYVDSTLKNKDTILCRMTSSEAGATPATVDSKPIEVSVTPRVVPAASITSTPSEFCEGTGVTVNATIANAGTAGAIQWMLNGKQVGSAPTLALNTLVQSDELFLILRSTAPCAQPSVVQSAKLQFVVRPLPPVPTVAYIKGVLNSSATAGNQWYRNNTLIDGATLQTYEPKESGDYTVSVTNEYGCISRSAAISVVASTVDDELQANVRVAPNPFTGTLRILSAISLSDATLVLTDIFGRELLSERHVELSAGVPHSILLPQTSSEGIYLLRITNGTRSMVLRCVQQ